MFRLVSLLITLPIALASLQDGDASKYEETLQKLVDGLGQMTKTLEMITDEDTAKANKSALRVHAEAFIETRKLSQTIAPPPAEVREKLAEKFRPEFEKARKEILGQIARVQRVPGGLAVLQELRGVFEKDDKK